MRRAVQTRHVATAALALGLGLVGCHDYELTLRATTTSSLQATVSIDGVRLYEGLAVGVQVLDHDERIPEDVTVAFASASPVVEVHPTPTHGIFAFYGVAQGQTTIHIEVDGEAWGDLPARVVAQPAP